MILALPAPMYSPKDFLGRSVTIETHGYEHHILRDRIGQVIDVQNGTHNLVRFDIDGDEHIFVIDVRDLCPVIGGEA